MTPTLLIVDDEKTTREGLRDALQDRYDVYLAEDAKSAMELLERDRPGIKQRDFHVEDQINQCDDIKAQVELHPGGSDGWLAAFVDGGFLGIGDARAGQRAGSEPTGRRQQPERRADNLRRGLPAGEWRFVDRNASGGCLCPQTGGSL